MATKRLSAKDVAYDKPGSVAAYYDLGPGNIFNVAGVIQSQYAKGNASPSAKNDRNVMAHIEKWLTKNAPQDLAAFRSWRDTGKVPPATGGTHSRMVNAFDYAVREEGRKQQTKGGGFLDFVKKFIGPAVGVAVGFAVPGLGPVMGATLGGAAQGGVEDGFKGAVIGGLRGYAVGSGAAWAAGKAGLTSAAPIIDKTTSLSGGTAAAGNTSSWLSNAAGNALTAAQTGSTVAGLAGGGKKDVSLIGDILGTAATTAGAALGGRLVSALVGDGGAGDSFDRADALTGQQGALIDKQTAIYDQLLKIGQQERDYYLKEYRPLENQMIADAKAGVKPDYEGITNTGAQASQEVSRQYGVARESYLRGLSRRGVNVGSGERAGMDLSLAMGEASDRAGAFTRGNIEEADKRRAERKYADEMTYNRRNQVTSLGRGISSTGINTVSSAASGTGSAVNAYGQQAGELRRLGQDQAIAAGDATSAIVNAGVGLYSRLRAA